MRLHLAPDDPAPSLVHPFFQRIPMQGTLADPPGLRTTRRRTPRQVFNALTTQLRLQPHAFARHFEWTVETSGMSDADLDTVVDLLAGRGLQATYTRELGWFAHFVLRW